VFFPEFLKQRVSLVFDDCVHKLAPRIDVSTSLSSMAYTCNHSGSVYSPLEFGLR
jgi:hypothetical protein